MILPSLKESNIDDRGIKVDKLEEETFHDESVLKFCLSFMHFYKIGPDITSLHMLSCRLTLDMGLVILVRKIEAKPATGTATKGD